jgi:hypothetical protein
MKADVKITIIIHDIEHSEDVLAYLAGWLENDNLR